MNNTCEEKDLADSLRNAMEKYPDAILVWQHGFYVWENAWKKAKTMCKSYDFSFINKNFSIIRKKEVSSSCIWMYA